MTIIPRDYTEDIIESKDYDDFVHRAQQIDDSIESGQWDLGDMVKAMVEYVKAVKGTVYGENLMDKFATDTNINPSTIRSYYSLSDYWTKELRADVFEKYPNVNRSILLEAKRADRTGDNPRRAKAFLRLCAMPTTVIADGKNPEDQVPITTPRQYRAIRMKLQKKPYKKSVRANFLLERKEDGTLIFICKGMHEDDMAQLQVGSVYQARLTIEHEDTDA